MMKMIKLGLALTAIVAGVAGTAQAATTYSTTATGSKGGGSKAAPASFGGSWALTANAGPGVRPASPVSWSWSWEGVVAKPKGFPICTAAQIDAAQSDSVCPKGSLVGVTGKPVIAQFGPANDPLTNVTCTGKGYYFYNAGPGAVTLYIAGPADQCAGIGYLAPITIKTATKNNSTTFKIDWPANLTSPLPGLKATLFDGGAQFPITKAKIKQGKKKIKSAYLQSVGCKGKRDFAFTVVDEEQGTTALNISAGTCTKPKGKKK